MPEPTGGEGLATFADELDQYAQRIDARLPPPAGGVWEPLGALAKLAMPDAAAVLHEVAGMARRYAEKGAVATASPQTATGEGPPAGELTGDLSAAAPIVITRDELLSEWRKAHPGECSCPPDRPDWSCPEHGAGLSASERDAVMADLGKLLEALGLGDCARPQSPHEVMLECIAEVAKIRAGEKVTRILAAIFACRSDDCPQPFGVYRGEDVTGVSGTGTVAHGVQFADGQVIIRWLGETPSTVVWESLDVAMKVHGHDGKTRVVWLAAPFSEMGQAEQEAAAAERARILAGAEALRHTTHGKAAGIVDWAELADLIEGKP